MAYIKKQLNQKESLHWGLQSQVRRAFVEGNFFQIQIFKAKTNRELVSWASAYTCCRFCWLLLWTIMKKFGRLFFAHLVSGLSMEFWPNCVGQKLLWRNMMHHFKFCLEQTIQTFVLSAQQAPYWKFTWVSYQRMKTMFWGFEYITTLSRYIRLLRPCENDCWVKWIYAAQWLLTSCYQQQLQIWYYRKQVKWMIEGWSWSS